MVNEIYTERISNFKTISFNVLFSYYFPIQSPFKSEDYWLGGQEVTVLEIWRLHVPGEESFEIWFLGRKIYSLCASV